MSNGTIQDFYRDQNVFITGATGFIGKVVVEKLLRSCPDLKGIYVMMRPKRGKSGKERIAVMTESVLFDLLKQMNPKALDKIHAVSGDCMKKQLGISEEELEIVKTCNIILHIAASVRFDDALQKAILMNTRGTAEVCELALKIPNLRSVVHVSTGYCNPNHNTIHEFVYPHNTSWKQYVQFAETIDEDTLDILTPKLTCFFPNTYTYTKKLAEDVVQEYKTTKNLPITILRPSIVTSSETEPTHGFIDNYNGTVGMSIACGSGIKRVALVDYNFMIDCMPVDIVGKSILVAAWREWRDSAKKEITVYNCAGMKPTKLGEYMEVGECMREYRHFSQFIWICRVTVGQCKFMQYIRMILYQWLPALIIDGILMLKTGKPMLLALHRKIYNADNSVNYFLTHTFTFITRNFKKLNDELLESDKEAFNMDERIPDVLEYSLMVMTRGIEFLLKPTPEEKVKAARRYKISKVIDLVVRSAVQTYAIYLVWNYIKNNYWEAMSSFQF